MLKRTNAAEVIWRHLFHLIVLVLFTAMAEALKETMSSAWTGVKRGLSSAPPNDAYLAWNAPGVETIKSEEEEKTQQIKDVMERMQKRNFDLHRHAFRATHVKTQGIVKGKLQVHSDLPEHLRQGIFAEPGKTYDVAARYANEPYLLQRDQEPGPRGLGLKYSTSPVLDWRASTNRSIHRTFSLTTHLV